MSSKKRILFVTETHKLASGFGTYAKEVISRLHKTGKYEIAQFACYSSPLDFDNTDWLIYGNAPTPNEKEYAKHHNSNPLVQWGVTRFEHICLDFKPDIVVTYRDPWMDAYIVDSPYLPFFHWVWMPTIDSEPQKNEWLYWFDRCDGLMAYSEFGIRTLEKQTNGRLRPQGCASPGIDEDSFNIIPNKKEHKKKFGLPEDSIVIGTVMRNQKRKMFPELIRAFRKFIDTADPKIANKTYLYLHTSYPEKHGWGITSLAHEFNIGSKLIVTYVCRSCKQYFCSHYRDAITMCQKCGQHSATLPAVGNGIEHKELSNIYNLMDLYVQYAICEGFGMPQVEAAACGVPIASVNYSAMEDVVHYTKGYKIEPHLNRELETNADRSSHNNDSLVQIFSTYAKQTEAQKKKQRLETRKGCIQRYTWDNAVKAWEKYFDNVEDKPLQGQWNRPPMIRPLPHTPPSNLNNQQFAEWICSVYLQDDYHTFGHKMLTILRDLNFGAKFDIGMLKKYTREQAFEENKSIAERRYHFDAIRCGIQEYKKPPFITEAHRRFKR